jgi:hypothetical protein
MPSDPNTDLEHWLRALVPERLEGLARRYAARAESLGLCVTRADLSQVPIPPVLSPVVVQDEWLRARQQEAADLGELIRKVTQGMLAGPERNEILGALYPIERSCIEPRGAPEQLADVRADLFLGPSGAQALELNTTIPAMQGYSDIAARAFLETAGAELGLEPTRIDQAIAANGENAVALLEALQQFCQSRFGKAFERVALVHRPADSQLCELHYLARRWEALGIHAHVVEMSELAWDGADKVTAAGARVDFVYRHIFARRIEPQSGLGRLLHLPQAFPLANPVSAPLEMKRTFAELSRTAHEPQLAQRLGLSEKDLELVRRFVPWTRPLLRGPTDLPDGTRVSDLVEHVAREPAQFVLKRSWDYGGKAVFLGFEADLPQTRAREVDAFGQELGWQELCQRAADDPRGGGFIVQERVVSQPEEHLIVTDQGPSWQRFFTDFSVFASVGQAQPRWGGVVRASSSAVVNIASGGGVAPVLRAGAAAELIAAAERFRP